MPLYDFECPHGHRFDRQCRIAEREEEVPCEGMVNQLASDEERDEFRRLSEEADPVIVEGTEFKLVPLDHPEGEAPKDAAEVVVKLVPCVLKASIVMGPHNNPGGALHHGLASNRDAAREGRYDPLNPNRRFMAKGRGYRK